MSSRTPPDNARAGQLLLVGTPIGNLGDLTFRAVAALKNAQVVAAEDTRRTRALLSHLGLHDKALEKLDAHASPGRIKRLLEHVAAGETVAVVTDAGMPGVSDPGMDVVREAALGGVSVSAIPGPSAVTMAVALSGLIEGPFLFLGFLPRKGGKRRESIRRIAQSPEPVILFESPARTEDTLKDLAAELPTRSGCVLRELTKLHEEIVRAPLAELAQRQDWRGEVVLVVEGAGDEKGPEPSELDLDAEIAKRLAAGTSVKSLSAELAQRTGLPRRDIYARAEQLKQRPGGN